MNLKKKLKDIINHWIRYPLIRFLSQPLLNQTADLADRLAALDQHVDIGKYLNQLDELRSDLTQINETATSGFSEQKKFNGYIAQELLFKTHVSMMCGNLPAVFAAMKNDPEFNKKVEEFSSEIDEESRNHLGLWLKKARMLPRYYGNETGVEALQRFNLPHAAGLLSPEDLFLVTNKDKILIDITSIYKESYDISEIPISLHVHYYNNGLIYIPDSVLEHARGTIALDCGAWVGDTAVMLHTYGFDAIHCFEPNPSTFAALCDNVTRNKDNGVFICHNKAVGDKFATLHMEGAGYLGGGSRIVEDGTIEVECVVLDDFWKESGRIGLIKFDVEGFEEAALRGAEGLIRKHKPILLVAAYHEWAAPGQMFELFRYIKSLDLGYRFIFRGMVPDYGLVYEYDLICYVPC